MPRTTPLSRILIVDDDEVDSRVTVRNLDRAGLSLDADVCHDPEDGLRRVSDTDYICLVLDFNFPSGTAFDIFGDLLRTPCSQRPPVILLTGLGDESIAAESILKGAQQYLSKTDLSPTTLRLALDAARERANAERAREEREQFLARLGFYDELTELPNRRLLFERLEQVTRTTGRTQGMFAVLMMDLDGFKAVNDTHGHDIGDRLLVAVADRLRAALRDSDTVARLGGDEFAALLPTVENLEGALVVADKIVDVVNKPFTVGGRSMEVSISIGAALFPKHGRRASDLLRHADLAMYEAKRSRQGVTVYGEFDGQHDTATIIQDLSEAIDRRELSLVYQPQIRLADGYPYGVEALVRWNHPQLGRLGPDRFIRAAEKSGVILDLTLFVLEEALTQAQLWHRHHEHLIVAVNLAAPLVGRTGLAATLTRLVRELGYPSDRLCLEVTETGMMQRPEDVRRELQTLAEQGVRISIDDFGTGFSSLRYLRDFPVGEIKIDREFVGGLANDARRDRVIVESVLALGDAFGVGVVAEGIETDNVASLLQSMGCAQGQGYFIAPPMGADDMTDWLTTRLSKKQR